MNFKKDLLIVTAPGFLLLLSSFLVVHILNTANADDSTTITPQQAIQNVVSTIDNMHLNRSVSISLETPLIFTIKLLNRQVDMAAGCNTFNAFLNNLGADHANLQLTEQQAATLIQQAAPIQHAMGCALSPTSFNYGTTTNIATNNTGASLTNPATAGNIKTPSTATTLVTTPSQPQQSKQQEEQHNQPSQQTPLIADGLNSHNNNADNRSPTIVSILPFS